MLVDDIDATMSMMIYSQSFKDDISDDDDDDDVVDDDFNHDGGKDPDGG